MATKKRTSRWASQAALQALVRFGPESSGLQELARQAVENRDTAIAQAHGGAQGILGAIDRATPAVTQIYDGPGLDQARAANQLVSTDLAALGPVANSIKAAAGVESTVAGRHLGEMKASNLADLQNRRVQTAQGETFAVQSAQRQFTTDLAKILARKQSLAQEQGAFTASTIGSLEQDALARALSARNSQRSATQSERNSLRSAGIDPDTGQPIPGGKADPKAPKNRRLPGGAKPRSTLQHGALKDTVEGIGAWIKANRADYPNRAAMAQDLVQGVKASTVTDPKTGQKVSDPGVPKAKSPLVASIALDIAYDGHVSRRNAKELHRRGFSLKDLGLPTYMDWKRQGGQASRAATNALAGLI